MIKDFEKQTFRLTKWELEDVMPLVIDILKSKVGKAQSITNKLIRGSLPETVSEARLRKIINYIRINDIVPCLLASNQGYYIATTPSEIIVYEYSLGGREAAIHAVRTSIHRQGIKRFKDAYRQASVEYNDKMKKKQRQQAAMPKKPATAKKKKRKTKK